MANRKPRIENWKENNWKGKLERGRDTRKSRWNSIMNLIFNIILKNSRI